MTGILQKGFEAQAMALRDFGYPDVTADQVSVAHAKWLKGESMSGIIEMFCERDFNERPDIFGTPTV